MRRAILSIVILLLLGACNNNDKESSNKLTENNSSKHNSEAISSQKERGKLILELKKFNSAIQNKDATGIANFFRFPLADTTLPTFDVNSSFDKERLEAEDQVTQKLFEKYFGQLYSYFQMDEFNKLFQSVNIDSLLKKDEVNSEIHYKNSGCYYMYGVSIDGSDITLFYGTNSDSDYLEKHPDAEMTCAEHTYHWIFTFDGQSLYLKRVAEAG